MIRDQIYVIGGGTVSYIRDHLAIANVSFGAMAYDISSSLREMEIKGELHEYSTKMAGDFFDAVELKMESSWRRTVVFEEGDPRSDEDYLPNLDTNEDVVRLVNEIIEKQRSRVLFLMTEPCAFKGFALGDERTVIKFVDGTRVFERPNTPSGPEEPALPPKENHEIRLEACDPLEGLKDKGELFVVGYCITEGVTEISQYHAGRIYLTKTKFDMVFVEDRKTGIHMIVSQEEKDYPYGVYSNRDEAIDILIKTSIARSEMAS